MVFFFSVRKSQPFVLTYSKLKIVKATKSVEKYLEEVIKIVNLNI